MKKFYWKKKSKKFYLKKKSRKYYRKKAKPSNYFIARSKVTYDNISCPAGLFTSGDILFYLNQVQDSASLISLFDNYKILKVKVKFIPQVTESSVGAAGGLPTLYTAIDTNSAPTTPTKNTIMAYKNCRTGLFDRTYSRTFRPMIQEAIYNGVTSTAYTPSSRWLSTGYDACPHYCLVWGVDGTFGTGNSMIFKYEVEYIVAFKNPR